MVLAVSITVFVIVTGAVLAFAYRSYLRPARVLEQLSIPRGGFQSYGQLGLSTTPAPDHGAQVRTVLQWLGERVPISPQDASSTRRLLSAAGYRTDTALAIYVGIRIVSAAVFLGLAGLLVVGTSLAPLVDLLLLFGGALVGYWFPGFVLEEFLIPSYQLTLRLALPDALDMLVICVESGVSLDMALKTVSEELIITHPQLCRELNLVSVEMRTGVRRAQALKNLAERTMEPEISKLVAMLVQTDRFGTSIADALRSHADFMRIRRRQDAEERAGKLGVKLIFPIFFLIMPSIFIIALGPAIISISKNLLPAMRGE